MSKQKNTQPQDGQQEQPQQQNGGGDQPQHHGGEGGVGHDHSRDEVIVGALPFSLRDVARQFLAAGMSLQQVIAVLSEYGPRILALGKEAAALVQEIIGRFTEVKTAVESKAAGVAPAAGDHCPPECRHIKEHALAILCHCLCLECGGHDHDDKKR
jgi:hypothetical protein